MKFNRTPSRTCNITSTCSVGMFHGNFLRKLLTPKPRSHIDPCPIVSSKKITRVTLVVPSSGLHLRKSMWVLKRKRLDGPYCTTAQSQIGKVILPPLVDFQWAGIGILTSLPTSGIMNLFKHVDPTCCLLNLSSGFQYNSSEIR